MRSRIQKFIIIVLILVLGIIVYGDVPVHVVQAEGTIEKKPYIAVPGFSEIHFKSGSTRQEVDIENPSTNSCWLKIIFRTPDGKPLFEIERLNPSCYIGEVELTRSLEAGLYENCIIHVECYMDGVRLNSANFAVDLYVDDEIGEIGEVTT